ncbi:Hypothetical protein D9617_9g024670 [Elsinoe fawcettii]|nr:Hypothetical protein D9617_9g024670 [Elsinoe fawcettii]
MAFLSSISRTVVGLLIATSVGLVNGHSWVEQMQEISADGSFIGPMGYPRSYVARTDPDFDGNAMNYLLPPLASGRPRANDEDLLCHPNQRTAKQADKYPALTVKPGAFVAMKYLENGHVTLPNGQLGKAKSGGTVFVYGTTSPKDDEKLMDVLKWSEDGKGGDGRGKLIAAQNFDDGRCHQINGDKISKDRQQEFPDRIPDQPTSNVEQWCETDVKLPSDVDSGKLTVYWVWQWNTAPGIDPGLPLGKDEYYTTCMDIIISNNQLQGSRKNVAEKNTLQQQDPQTKAPDGFKDRTAYIKSPLGSGSDNNNNNNNDPTPSTPASASTPPISSASGAEESSTPPPTTKTGRGRKTRTRTATTTMEEEDEEVFVTVTVTERMRGTSAPSATASASAPTAPPPAPSAQPSRSSPPNSADNGIPRTTLLSRARDASLAKTPDELAAEPKIQTDAPCSSESSSPSTLPPSASGLSASLNSPSGSVQSGPASSTFQANLSDKRTVTRVPGTLITSIIPTATKEVPKVILTTALPNGQIGKDKDEGLIGARDARRKLGPGFPSLKDLKLKTGSKSAGSKGKGFDIGA